MKLHYLGPTGTFTEQAAKKLARRAGLNVEMAAAPSIQAVFATLRTAGCGAAAVVPYYNYLEGLVQETIDGIFETGATIAAAQRMPIVFSLGRSPRGGSASVVYSHGKGLSQCSDYLAQHYPNARLEAVSSTAEAARLAAITPGALAIARREALQLAGLDVVAEDIGNLTRGRKNYTEFLLLGAAPPPARPHEQFRTMVAVHPYEDRVGLLSDILNQFAFYRINLAKIHSRPGVRSVDTAFDPQMFYFEATCRDTDPDFVQCAAAINYRLGVPNYPPPFQSLGCYPLFEHIETDTFERPAESDDVLTD
jgi:prephenate dehydratase